VGGVAHIEQYAVDNYSIVLALFVSGTSGVFDFVEHGYQLATVVAIAADVAAEVVFITFLLANGMGLQRDPQTGAVRAADRP
jgi:hypothetical protein